MKALDHVLDA